MVETEEPHERGVQRKLSRRPTSKGGGETSWQQVCRKNWSLGPRAKRVPKGDGFQERHTFVRLLTEGEGRRNSRGSRKLGEKNPEQHISLKH